MVKFRHRGSETVDAGIFWNFETGEKVRLQQRGLLPGAPSQSYYKVPPLLLLAFAAAAAHVFMYILPKYLVQFYAVYTEKLVASYVVLDFIFIAAVVIGIVIAGTREILSGAVSWPFFRSSNLATSRVRNENNQQNGSR